MPASQIQAKGDFNVLSSTMLEPSWDSTQVTHLKNTGKCGQSQRRVASVVQGLETVTGETIR